MTPAELESALTSGAVGPVYLLHGEDHVTRRRLVQALSDLVPEEARDFNFQSFLADETRPGAVLGPAQTMPFLSPLRVLVVHGVDQYSAEDLAVFQRYLEKPNESTCLVLVAEKADMRMKFFKGLREQQREVACLAPKGALLTDWIQESMALRGREMSAPAARLLVEMVGTDLAALDSELEKVYLGALNRKSIGPAEVRSVARLCPTANVFALGKAIGFQEPAKALAALHDQLMTQHHLPILAMIVRHFRLLLKAKIMEISGGGEGRAAQYLKVPPFAAREALDQARELTLADIKAALARLLAANLTLVTTATPEHLVMEKLVLDLASLRPRRRSARASR